jgi:hypothetical protein
MLNISWNWKIRFERCATLTVMNSGTSTKVYFLRCHFHLYHWWICGKAGNGYECQERVMPMKKHILVSFTVCVDSRNIDAKLKSSMSCFLCHLLWNNQAIAECVNKCADFTLCSFNGIIMLNISWCTLDFSGMFIGEICFLSRYTELKNDFKEETIWLSSKFLTSRIQFLTSIDSERKKQMSFGNKNLVDNHDCNHLHFRI